MAKFDKQLSRMSFLMEYNMPKNEVKSNIEYHANGADGNVYGILKEGNKYYIKKTTSGKENIAESYDYLNGFNNRKENEYKSYNEATKHLELKLMSLNESYGKHEDVSTVDFNRGEKTLMKLTEAARKELNRMNQIFENSQDTNIKTGSAEYGKADVEKKGAPYGEGEDVKVDIEIDKGCKGGKCGDAKKANKDYTTAKLGKGMNIQEGIDEEDIAGLSSDMGSSNDMGSSDMSSMPVNEEDDSENGDDLGSLINEYEQAISGDYDELTGPGTDNKKNAIATWERIDEDSEYDPDPEEGIQALDGPRGSGKHIATWDRVTGKQSERLEGSQSLNEAVNREVKRIMKNYGINETIEEKIQRLVNEEVTRLDAWGKHPRFRKQPMTLPQNKEKFVGTADRDWNDDSAKGEQPYGQKIGDGKPFDKTVEMLTDNVLSQLKESLLKKK